MELWVRSQDKTNLVKPYNIYVNCDLDTYRIYAQTINSYLLLGIYPIKERALEVLDDIQNKIAQNQSLISLMPKITDLKGSEEKISKLFKDMIYEMPEK